MRTFLTFALYVALAATLPAQSPTPSREAPVLLKATTVLDGKGSVLKNTSILVEGPGFNVAGVSEISSG